MHCYIALESALLAHRGTPFSIIMGFLGIYRAIYDYSPQSEGELSISEGDLLCVVEKSKEDDWWKAKKKASVDEEDEPVGLVPNNYVEEVRLVAPWLFL